MDPSPRAAAILQFWFGELQAGLMDDGRRRSLFRADSGFDDRVRTSHGEDVEQALSGALDHWSTTLGGRMALVLLLDQFTRNVFRGSAGAYAGDTRALELAREGVGRGDDRRLPLEMRAFFYLPFGHSESRVDQDTGVRLFEALLDDQAPDSKAARVAGDYLGHARSHRALIRRFGRFPHRNAVLGRVATAAEQGWLARDGRRFGQ